MNKKTFCISAVIFISSIFTTNPLLAQKGNANYQDSPFGLWSAHANQIRKRSDPVIADIPSMSDLSVHWSAPCNPPFLPSDWTLWESYYDQYKNTGIYAVPMIDLASKRGNGAFTLSPTEYYDSIKKAVNYFKDIDYWMLGVEVDNLYNRGLITPEKYALYIRLTYKALKDTRPTAKLAAAGTGGTIRSYQGEGFFVLVFDKLRELENIEKNPSSYNWDENSYALNKKDFDLVFEKDNYDKYMDAHHFSNFDMEFTLSYYKQHTTKLIQAIKALLDNYGYSNVALWDTQTGTYNGQPAKPLTRYSYQSEAGQANDLVRKYVLSLVLGVDKIFWTTTYEFLWFGEPEHYFSKVGLIYNGLGEDDPGLGVKKLAYYTYKLMVEKLEASDWDNIQTIQEKDDVYIYKFTRQGKPIWVAWGDCPKIVSLKVDSDKVTITEAIPDAENGAQLTKEVGFKSEAQEVTGGYVSFSLSANPVYIEEGEVPAPVYEVREVASYLPSRGEGARQRQPRSLN